MLKYFINKLITQNLSILESCSITPDDFNNATEIRQLYIHIPFCKQLCPYCSFHRMPFDENKVVDYFKTLRKEIRLYHKVGFKFTDVYIGGGTPTVIPSELHETLLLLKSLFPVSNISVETNPTDLRDEIITILRNNNISRLSVGVQTFDDELLKNMKRYYTYGNSEEIRRRLLSVQGVFKTLNVDMIFNLPGQTIDSLKHDIETIIDIGVDQVSFYPLMASPAVKVKIRDVMGKSDHVFLKNFYYFIIQTIENHYKANSVWCFSKKPGMIDEYVIEHDNYIGIGSGAFSYIDGTFYTTTFSVDQYIDCIEHGYTGITYRKNLNLKQRIGYDFLMKLFGTKLDCNYIANKYGNAFWITMFPEISALSLISAIKHDGKWLRLTKYGMYVWILLMVEFFNSVNTFREQMRNVS